MFGTSHFKIFLIFVYWEKKKKNVKCTQTGHYGINKVNMPQLQRAGLFIEIKQALQCGLLCLLHGGGSVRLLHPHPTQVSQTPQISKPLNPINLFQDKMTF